MRIGDAVILIGILIAIFGILCVAALFLFINQRRKNHQKQKVTNVKITATEIEEDLVKRKNALVDIIAPDGINTEPASYTIIDDAGQQVYVRCFTVDSLPKKTKFATTFRPIFKFHNCHTSIFVKPEYEDTTKRKLDRHITVLDGEQSTAVKKRERTRVRSLQSQLNTTEEWVDKIENGYDKFYKVQFLFVLRERTLQELNVASESFYNIAKKQQIDICATYACHPESFLSGAPYGSPYTGEAAWTWNSLTVSLENRAPLKTHYMSRGAVADLFNHISADFRHKNGVPLGRTLLDGKVVLFDPYDETHIHGYGIIFAGKTGSGKTTTIKVIAKRLHNTSKKRYRFAIIDSQRRSNRGEYSSLADDLNGVCHVFKHNSGRIINLCEVSVQKEFDEDLQTEYYALHLAERKEVIIYDLMILIQGSKPEAGFELATHIESELRDVIDECFDELEIYDGQPDSLYTLKKEVNENGDIIDKKVKKQLPTISMVYQKLLSRSLQDTDHKKAIGLMLDALKSRVRLLGYFLTDKGYVFLPEEKLGDNRRGMKYVHTDGKEYEVTIIRGNQEYFDGQSTVEFSTDCACTDFDISSLPEKERKITKQVIMSFVTEEFSSNNSMNYKSDAADKLVVILDECQDNYDNPFMRHNIESAYRTNRKRHVSTWIGQQQLSDGSQYEEIEKGVLSNTAVFFLFKQPEGDKEFLKKHTILNDTQIDTVTRIGLPPNLSNDPDEALQEMQMHAGECCLIDGGRAVFIKIDVLKESEQYLIASNRKTLQEIFNDEYKTAI